MSNTFINTTFMDGFADGPHVTAEQTGIANQGLYGADDYVLDTGRRSEAQILTNNSIRIFDAVYVIQGRRDVIPANGYTDIAIDNGVQGQYRHDIIVRRYQKDSDSEIETTSYVVIKGIPASSASAAYDPEVKTGDIRSGDTLHNMKLYRVTLEGLNIASVKPLFNVMITMEEMQNKIMKLEDSENKRNILIKEVSDVAAGATKTVSMTDSLESYTVLSVYGKGITEMSDGATPTITPYFFQGIKIKLRKEVSTNYFDLLITNNTGEDLEKISVAMVKK